MHPPLFAAEHAESPTDLKISTDGNSGTSSTSARASRTLMRASCVSDAAATSSRASGLLKYLDHLFGEAPEGDIRRVISAPGDKMLHSIGEVCSELAARTRGIP